jgi:serine/threonine-protein kinase
MLVLLFFYALLLTSCQIGVLSAVFRLKNEDLNKANTTSSQTELELSRGGLAAPDIGSELRSEKDGAIMMFVPAGKFPMGSEDGSADEIPVHLVDLDAFWIDQTEVTNAQYALCVNEGICSLPTDPTRFYDVSYTQHPVVFLEWEDADAYCEWAGRRLPTEAEWEKAARGTDGRTYPWGEESDCSRANFWDCPEFESTSPVGHYGDRGISPYGLYDMAGNVWEWVWDWYDVDYYQDSPASNPSGPTSGIYHVWRGGSWNCNQTSARSAGRGNYNPDYWRDLIGFRCAMDADHVVLSGSH